MCTDRKGRTEISQNCEMRLFQFVVHFRQLITTVRTKMQESISPDLNVTYLSTYSRKYAQAQRNFLVVATEYTLQKTTT